MRDGLFSPPTSSDSHQVEQPPDPPSSEETTANVAPCPLCGARGALPLSEVEPKTPDVSATQLVCVDCGLKFDPTVRPRRQEETNAVAAVRVRSWDSDEGREVLDRWLNGEPIVSHKPTEREKLSGWCRRNRAVVCLTTLASVFVVGWSAWSTVMLASTSLRLRDVSVARHEAGQRVVELRGELKDSLVALRTTDGKLASVQNDYQDMKAEHSSSSVRLTRTRKELDEAVRDRQLALQQARHAEVRYLVHEARGLMEVDRSKSLLLGSDAADLTRHHGECLPPFVEQVLRDALSTVDGGAMRGHVGRVDRVKVSGDGRWLVTAGEDLTVRVWDLHATAPVPTPRVLLGHTGRITGLDLSRNGRWVTTVSMDGTGRVWDLAENDPSASAVQLRGSRGRLSCVAVSPDATRIVTASAGLGPDENVLQVWSLDALGPGSRGLVLRGHERPVGAVRFSPDGQWLVSVGEDETTRLWHLTDADPEQTATVLHGLHRWGSVLAISDNGRWLATVANDHAIRMCDLTAADPLRATTVLTGHQRWVRALAISPNNRWLASGSDDGTARLWDLEARDVSGSVRVFHGHQHGVSAVAITPDARTLVTASDDHKLRMWNVADRDVETAPVVLAGHHSPVHSLTVSPDGRWLISASEPTMAGEETTLRLWTLPAERLVVLARQTAQPGVDTAKTEAATLQQLRTAMSPQP